VLAEISAAAAKAQVVLAKEALEKAGADAAAARVSENLTGAVNMIRRLLRKEHEDPATWKFGKGIVDQVMQVWGSRVKRKSLSARWALCKNDEDRPIGVGGGQYLLSSYEEVRLVAWVEALRSLNLAPTMSDVVSKASDILECRGVTSTPSETWVRKLCDRHDLVLRAARSKEQARASLTPDQIAMYFRTVEQHKDATTLVSPTNLC
jgi:hypothetical protein